MPLNLVWHCVFLLRSIFTCGCQFIGETRLATLSNHFEYVLLMILADYRATWRLFWFVERLGRKITLAAFISVFVLCRHIIFGQTDSVNSIMFWGCLMSFFNLGGEG